MKLKEYRKKHRMTQEEVAQRIDCAPATISRYESGRVPRLAVIRQIKAVTAGAVTEDDWQEAGQ